MPQEAVTVSADLVELPTETTDDLEKVAKTEAEKTKGQEEPEVEIEVEEEQPKKGKVEGRDFEKENAELQQQLLDIGTEVRVLRAQLEDKGEEEKKPKGSKKAAEPAGEEISDDQLLAVMEEHKDNPGVLLRVYKHLAEQAATKVATGIRDETMRDVEYQTWHRELRTHNDQVMEPVYQAEPKMKAVVSDTVNRLGLKDHPMGGILAYSLIQYARGQQKETSKADEKEAKRVEELTKVKGLDKTRTSGDKVKGKVSLSEEQKKVADKLGVSHEAYAKFVPKE